MVDSATSTIRRFEKSFRSRKYRNGRVPRPTRDLLIIVSQWLWQWFEATDLCHNFARLSQAEDSTFKYEIRRKPRLSRRAIYLMRRKFNGVTRRLSKVTRNKTTASVFLFLSYARPRTVSRSSPFPPESAFPCRCLEGRIVNQKPRGSPENSRRKREEKRVSHGDKGERVGGWRASRRRK